ncbi:hypothetical protein KY311_03025 [Candidatus Woesearchaeota archaeon]|nr:hypothetical protein [Candidatus Woesearchaeota archaeon]
MVDDDEKFEEEESIEEGSLDEQEHEIREGDEDADPYQEAGREELAEEDEISPREEAFMEGEEKDVEEGVCEECGTPLSDDSDEVVELEVNEKKHFFCSDDCAEKYKSKHRKELK